MKKQIILLIGQPCSGKTTISNFIKNFDEENYAVIDGDMLRNLYNNKDYSKEGRKKNVEIAFTLAKYLYKYMDKTPIIALVCPFREEREALKREYPVKEVYLTYTEERGREDKHTDEFEPPLEDFIQVNTTGISIRDAANKIMKYLKDEKPTKD